MPLCACVQRRVLVPKFLVHQLVTQLTELTIQNSKQTAQADQAILHMQKLREAIATLEDELADAIW